MLDNTAVDGWYYLYGTEGSLYCYRSKDLMDWERVGNALDNMGWSSPGKMSEVRRATWKDIWAPEVVYDPDEEIYYMFFSATPEADENIEIPNLTENVKELILSKASEDFDWSDISPTIFGAVFESTLNPETRRSGGMHYTSIENIHKEIDPLFLTSKPYGQHSYCLF